LAEPAGMYQHHNFKDLRLLSSYFDRLNDRPKPVNQSVEASARGQLPLVETMQRFFSIFYFSTIFA
jgi:hypothetical protein